MCISKLRKMAGRQFRAWTTRHHTMVALTELYWNSQLCCLAVFFLSREWGLTDMLLTKKDDDVTVSIGHSKVKVAVAGKVVSKFYKDCINYGSKER